MAGSTEKAGQSLVSIFLLTGNLILVVHDHLVTLTALVSVILFLLVLYCLICWGYQIYKLNIVLTTQNHLPNNFPRALSIVNITVVSIWILFFFTNAELGFVWQ